MPHQGRCNTREPSPRLLSAVPGAGLPLTDRGCCPCLSDPETQTPPFLLKA